MSDLSYRLAVLTHGQHDELVTHALASFHQHVRPLPEMTILHRDIPQEGFCKATAALWTEAADGDHDYVFWLEHDFEFVRPVDLTQIATVLDNEPKLAQMALMRDACSDEERDAGGLYELGLRRGNFEPQRHYVYEDDLDIGDQMGAEIAQYPWLKQSYFTTNPSLMRRDFMAENPWPPYDERCEGLFGIDLREKGYKFGTWGNGEIWVNHIGKRDGFGY